MITNIGPAHLELLGSIEAIAAAKAELVDELPAGGVAIVPNDPLLEPHLGRTDISVVRVDPAAPVPFRTSYSSEHQLANARTALAVAEQLGVPLPNELWVEFSRSREEERELPGGGLLLNDCYNANPVSMRAALEHLAARSNGRRKVAVLGEMASSEPEGPVYHREIGGLLRELGIVDVISVGELARDYGGRWVATADEAAAALRARSGRAMSS